MPQSWSNKRERQYKHIEQSEAKQGRSTKRAKQIAAATVNKQRRQKGETSGSSKSRSKTSRKTRRKTSSKNRSRTARSSNGRGGSRSKSTRSRSSRKTRSRSR